MVFLNGPYKKIPAMMGHNGEFCRVTGIGPMQFYL